MYSFLNINLARTLAAIFNAFTVMSGAVLYGGTMSPQLGGSPVDQEGIYVSLPVFIVSILATASFTWVVARHDAARAREVEKLTKIVSDLSDKMDASDERKKGRS